MVEPREQASASGPPGGGGEEGLRKGFLLRLPPALLAELRAWAGQEVRSLNGHIEYLLREALRARRRDAP
jgi:hypothetical protein